MKLLCLILPQDLLYSKSEWTLFSPGFWQQAPDST